MFPFSITTWVLLALLSSAVLTAGYYVREYDSRGSEIAVLKAQQVSKNNEIRVLEQSIKLGKDTNDTLNSRLGERNRDLKAACDLVAEIETATDPDADAPVSGIIGRVLEKLKPKR